jgi:hypothetical protein
MPTPPDRERPHEGPPLDPIVVLRPRRTDALAELLREYREGSGRYEAVRVPAPSPRAAPPHAAPRVEEETQELPQVPGGRSPFPRHTPRGRPRGPRRIAVAGAVAAAAVVGFGCALLLPGRSDATAVPAPSPPQATPAAPVPPVSAGATGPGDPDGPGTLREGADGPEVTDLQQRLLRIPNIYDHGSTSGVYDATLTEAVARFQLWYGIRGDETGVYGDDTRLALESRTGGG